MKIKDKLSLRKIVDEYIMIADDGECIDYTKAISLNATAVFLIEQTGQEEFTAESWAELLCEHYDVSYEEAHRDVVALIDTLYEIGIIA